MLHRRALTWLMVSVTGYAACSIMANVMSVRILRIGPDWASFSVDAGTLTYPLTFTLRDLVHKVGGRTAARVVILSTAGLNVLAALGMWATANLPGDVAVGPDHAHRAPEGVADNDGARIGPAHRAVLPDHAEPHLVVAASLQRILDGSGHAVEVGGMHDLPEARGGGGDLVPAKLQGAGEPLVPDDDVAHHVPIPEEDLRRLHRQAQALFLRDQDRDLGGGIYPAGVVTCRHALLPVSAARGAGRVRLPWVVEPDRSGDER